MTVKPPLTPGVYIEEYPGPPRPIAGVSTGIPVFIGYGGEAVRKEVRSLAEFERDCGGDGDLAESVRAFFENGGRRCYMVSLTRDGAPAAADFRAALAMTEDSSDADLVVLPGAARLDPGDYGSLVACALDYCALTRKLALIEQREGADFGAVNLEWGTDCTLSGGAVAGIYAATDAARGVWSAPANARISTRTLAPDGEWKYVKVRRLFVFVERSIELGTQWAVFEPNGPRLWEKVRRAAEVFLIGLFREGAFAGGTPQEAFFVRCDHTTTSQTDIEMGRLNLEIGLAPLKPAEFVICRISRHACQTA